MNDPVSNPDMGGLASLPGLDSVRAQLAAVIAVIEAERARRDSGITVTRRRWNNLVFTGGAGAGKSRTAEAVARIYCDLGVLTSGHMVEVTSAELADTTAEGTAKLANEVISRARGGVLLLTDAHAYAGLRVRDQQVLRCVHEGLTQFRNDLAVILAGQATPLRTLLRGSPALAARFPVVIEFPGYTAGQLGGIFATLAAEAGFSLTAEAMDKASVVLEEAEGHSAHGSARLAARLLDQATVSQAMRVAGTHQTQGPAELSAIYSADLPDHLSPLPAEGTLSADRWPGQYL